MLIDLFWIFVAAMIGILAFAYLFKLGSSIVERRRDRLRNEGERGK